MYDRTATCWILAAALLLAPPALSASPASTAMTAPPTQNLPGEHDIGSSWIADPAWMRCPPAPLETPALPQSRPEPIPLPAAAVVGPFMLTAMIASFAIRRSRRARARILR